MDIDISIGGEGQGHGRTNEYVGKLPIKEAVKKQNIKIATKKIVAIYKWFYGNIK
jgi:hypothetical protein